MFSKNPDSRSWSLATRLTIWYSVASLLFAVFTTGSLYLWLDAFLTHREDLVLVENVHALQEIVRDRPNAMSNLRQELDWDSPVRHHDDAQIYVRVLDDHGQPRVATPGIDSLFPTDVFARSVPAKANPTRGVQIRSDQGLRFQAIAALARVGGPEDKPWVIQIARDRQRHTLLLANYRLGSLVMLAISAIVCPLVTYIIAQRGLRPIREISDTARNIGSATLSERIAAEGYPIEVGALAKTFNSMLDRLEDSFCRISQFSADIAHELRTPIHNLRGEAEVTLSRARSIEEYKEALTSCLEETVRLSDLIGRLLFLARAENPGTLLEREQVHLAEELDAVREYYADAASEAEVTLAVAAGDDVVTSLDRGLVRGAIGNLVANSLAHTVRGDVITLAVRSQNGDACIEVCDTGTGIPAEHLARVFDRFYRADRSRSSQFGSMGLGLSIVKGIVTLHGGQTDIESEVGKGTKIVLRFPLEKRFIESDSYATPPRK